MQQNLAKMGADGLRDAAIFIKRLRSSTGVRAILFFAKSEPRITTTQEDYDKDVHLLNTPGGTVELVTGLMRPHRQSDLITKITRVTPDAHHTEKYFSDFLDEITLSRSDLKQALQRYFGAGCSGKNPKDKMALLFGSGSNGKTVLLESAAHCLGAYAATLDIKFLCSDEAFKSNSGHQDAIAQLAGVRFCSAIESKSGDRMNEGNVKRLTGGDGIPVSRKHEHTFTMYPAFQLFILTNHKPKIAGRDDGIWRRIELLPFDFKIPEERKDLDFKEKLLDADAPYIMAWLIDGCRKWYAGGYGSYQTTSAATKDYKQNEDTIGAFIDDCCTVDPGFSVQAGQLRTAYEKWAKDTGEYIFSGRAWRGALEERGFTRSHGRTGKRWAGLKVNEDENNDFV
jgi:putative DNA primase/helicase